MKIIHVVRQFYPFIGGLESAVRELAREQVASGNDVTVITLRRRLGDSSQVLPERGLVDGIKVIRLRHVGSRRYPIAPQIIKYVTGADVVHVHAIDFFFDYLALVNLFLRKTLVVSTHGGFFHTKKFARLKNAWFNTVTRLSLGAYAAVICVSQQDELTFRKIRKNGIRTILNGIDVTKFRSVEKTAEPDRSLVTIGRFAPNKRYDGLLDLMVHLRSNGNWRLTIVGAPDQISAEELRQMIKIRQLEETVKLLISPTDDEVRDCLANAGAFISASAYEGFGIAAIEALSAGLPLVLSDIKPYADLLHALGEGLLVDFDNPHLASKHINDWWQTVEHSKEARHRRIAFADRYGSASVAQATQGVYQAATGTATRHISGLDIAVMRPGEAILEIEERLLDGKTTRVVFANSNLVTTLSHAEKHALSADSDTLILNDGVALDAASVLLYRRAFPSNLNGTDFMGALLSGLRSGLDIFLLGAKPGVAERAVNILKELYPQHRVVGQHHGYFAEENTAELLATIRSSQANAIICAMGNPLQERWLQRNLEATGCQLGIAVGAYLDFVTGDVPRAPDWIRKIRMEWLFRLTIEPHRLARRYTLGTARFFAQVVEQSLLGHRMR